MLLRVQDHLLSDEDRIRLWELIELLERELSSPQPDWKQVKAAAKELWQRVRGMT